VPPSTWRSELVTVAIVSEELCLGVKGLTSSAIAGCLRNACKCSSHMVGGSLSGRSKAGVDTWRKPCFSGELFTGMVGRYSHSKEAGLSSATAFYETRNGRPIGKWMLERRFSSCVCDDCFAMARGASPYCMWEVRRRTLMLVVKRETAQRGS